MVALVEPTYAAVEIFFVTVGLNVRGESSTAGRIGTSQYLWKGNVISMVHLFLVEECRL